MGELFNMDSPFMDFMMKVADIVLVNIVYVLCCMPIFTIGAATTALYYSMLKLTEDRGSSSIKSFFHSFKENFIQATAIWLIIVILGALLGIEFFVVQMYAGDLQKALEIVMALPAVVLMMLMTYVFAVLAKFDNTIGQTMKNAILLAIGNLPYTVVMLVLNVLPFAICVYSIRMLPVSVMIGFAGVAYLNSIMFLKIFRKFVPKEQEYLEEEIPSEEELSDE